MITYQLTVRERLVLIASLPKEGDFTTLKLVRKVRETLSFSEEEHKALEFKSLDNGILIWNQKNEPVLDFDCGEKVQEIIENALRKLDKEHHLTEDHLSLFEKFLPTK
jgi:hypothetical protein